VETRIQGGAMHTAEYALDQGREVFAVPGNIDSPSSKGTNLLIKKGNAKLVQDTDDILVELNLISTAETKIIPKDKLQLNLFEENIFEILDAEPIHIDIIAERTGMSTADCLVHLLGLEFKGAVRQYPGKLFAKL
jgi:DNA processing protein